MIDWLEDAESHLDSELEISNDPDKIKLQLSKHKVKQFCSLGAELGYYCDLLRNVISPKKRISSYLKFQDDCLPITIVHLNNNKKT